MRLLSLFVYRVFVNNKSGQFIMPSVTFAKRRIGQVSATVQPVLLFFFFFLFFSFSLVEDPPAGGRRSFRELAEARGTRARGSTMTRNIAVNYCN